MSSLQRIIEERIGGYSDGHVFVPADFLDVTSMVNINNVLVRLLKCGAIRRPLRGVYSKPYFSKALDRELTPEPESVVAAVAKKNNWIIAPAGQTALNRLGLSSQIPAVIEYVSSGPDKVYDYDGFQIRLKHRANRDMLKNSLITQTFIQALKALGKNGVDDTTIDRLSEKLTKEQAERIADETCNATSWVFEAAQKLKGRYA
ncbi:MAG: DUF6088 family protein [Coriobacteriales bacterium]|jgi:hypothetical protein|nr:DUF6088 family protein [Coriobacteriales bacterium]